MSLSTSDTEKVAMLARLQFSPAELAEMSVQLAQVLDYIDLLQQIDMSDIAPLAHPAELRDVFAEDVPLPSLNRDAALSWLQRPGLGIL